MREEREFRKNLQGFLDNNKGMLYSAQYVPEIGAIVDKMHELLKKNEDNIPTEMLFTVEQFLTTLAPYKDGQKEDTHLTSHVAGEIYKIFDSDVETSLRILVAEQLPDHITSALNDIYWNHKDTRAAVASQLQKIKLEPVSTYSRQFDELMHAINSIETAANDEKKLRELLENPASRKIILKAPQILLQASDAIRTFDSIWLPDRKSEQGDLLKLSGFDDSLSAKAYELFKAYSEKVAISMQRYAKYVPVHIEQDGVGV